MTSYEWYTLVLQSISIATSFIATLCAIAAIIYTSKNLKEIKEHFNLSLDYANVSEIINLLRRLYSHVEYEEEVFTLDFPSPLAALRHLQATGVTGIGNTNIAKIRSYPYKSLTYRVGYFLVYR